MTKKLLILDKDGTLVTPKSGDRFPQHPQDQELLPNVAETLERYAADGWKMAIASNQGGVAAGYKILDDAIDEMHYCLELLPRISFGLLCPDDGFKCWHVAKSGEATCITNAHKTFRKPKSGMLDFAATKFFGNRLWKREIEVLYIGDRPEDEAAAQAAGVSFMWAHEWLLNQGVTHHDR